MAVDLIAAMQNRFLNYTSMSVFSRNSLITVKHLKLHMLHQYGAPFSAPKRLALLSRNDDSVCACGGCSLFSNVVLYRCENCLVFTTFIWL